MSYRKPKEVSDATKRKAYDEKWTEPTQEFREWFEPKYFDPVLGDIGGHDEARRSWPHKDNAPGQKCEFRTLGCSTTAAWNTDRIRKEFDRAMGWSDSPAEPEPEPVSPSECAAAIKAAFDRIQARMKE